MLELVPVVVSLRAVAEDFHDDRRVGHGTRVLRVRLDRSAHHRDVRIGRHPGRDDLHPEVGREGLTRTALEPALERKEDGSLQARMGGGTARHGEDLPVDVLVAGRVRVLEAAVLLVGVRGEPTCRASHGGHSTILAARRPSAGRPDSRSEYLP